jgi:chromosome partitioning protein
MRTCVITQTKGGVGKTSLTFALGVEAARAGHSVLLLDGDDTQRSLTSLIGKRSGEYPAIAEVTSGSIRDALNDPAVQAYDVVLIDGPPRASLDVRELVRQVDFVLLPVGASPLDVEASNVILKHVHGRVPFAYVIARADPRRSVVGQVHGILAAAYPLGPTIYERSDWVTAAGSGQAPVEWNPSGKAAGEITALWQYVDAQMRMHANT